VVLKNKSWNVVRDGDGPPVDEVLMKRNRMRERLDNLLVLPNELNVKKDGE
jgi:hypothetical protein